MNTLSQSQIAELVKVCVAHLHQSQAKLALMEIEIAPEAIPNANSADLTEYYTCLIKHLHSKEDFLEQWLKKLAQYHYTFAEEWLQRIQENMPPAVIAYNKSQVLLLEEVIESKNRELRNFYDKDCHDLIVRIRGDEKTPCPVPQYAVELVKELKDFLHLHHDRLSVEMLVNGWGTISNGFANLYLGDRKSSQNYILEARQAIDKAREIALKLPPESAEYSWFLRAKAKLLFAQGEPQKALQSLEDFDDPKMINMRLAILEEIGDIANTELLIKKHPIDPVWAPRAIAFFMAKGEREYAKTLYTSLEQLNPDALEQTGQLQLSFAESLLQYALELCGVPRGGKATILAVPDQAKSIFSEILQIIEPILGRPENLKQDYQQFRALVLRMQINYYLRKIDLAAKDAQKFLEIAPLNENIINIFICRATNPWSSEEKSRFEPIYKNLCECLVQGFPDQIWALEAHAAIAYLFFEDCEKAYQLLKKLLETAEPAAEKEAVAGNFYSHAEELGRVEEAKSIIQKSLPSGSLAWKMIEAREFWLQNKWEDAQKILQRVLQSNPDASISFKAHVMSSRIAIYQENWDLARQRLGQALGLLPEHSSKDIIRDLLLVATRMNDDQEVIKLTAHMEKLGWMTGNYQHLRSLAFYNLGQYEASEQILRELVATFPDNPSYVCELARVCIPLNRHGEAVKILETFKNRNPFNKDVIGLWGHLLVISGEAKRAFKELSRMEEQFWDDPVLLHLYMTAGYKCGEDEKVLKPFMRLAEIAPPNLLRKGSLEELKPLLTQFHQQKEEGQKKYQQAAVFRENLVALQNQSFYLDWGIRTQYYSNLLSCPADLVIYNTSGIRYFAEEKRYDLFCIPDDCEKIVIGYDALITLHRLEMLEDVAKRFTAIFYPIEFRHCWLSEQGSLQPHQLSQEDAMGKIAADISTNKIEVIATPQDFTSSANEEIVLARNIGGILINAFTHFTDVESQGVVLVGIKAIAHWLYLQGYIKLSDYQSIQKYQGDIRPIDSKEMLEALADASSCVIEQTTLKLMYSSDLTATLLQKAGKRIVITTKTSERIQQENREREFRRQIYEYQKDLTQSKIRSMAKYQAQATPRNPDDKDSLSEMEIIAAYPMQLAERLDIPLITDDRLKLLLFDQMKPGKAFSTDALINSLFKLGIIDVGQYAKAFLQLCRWRYRFLIPTPEILFYFACQHPENPVGQELVEIARYAHQCMQDPGINIFIGAEKGSMALWVPYQTSWVSCWIDFLTKVWDATEIFSDKNAALFTYRVWQECLPPLPIPLDKARRTKTAEALEQQILQKVLCLALPTQNQHRRISQLIAQTFVSFYPAEQVNDRLCESLGKFLPWLKSKFTMKLGEKETTAIATWVIREILGEASGITPQLAATFKQFGINLFDEDVHRATTASEQDSNLSQEIARLWASNPKECSYAPDNPINKGPLKLLKKTDTNHLLVPHNLVLAPDRELRLQALNMVLKPPDSKRTYVAEYTKRKIEESLAAIKSEDPYVWMNTASKIEETISHDFRYAFHALWQIGGLNADKMDMFLNQLLDGLMEPIAETIWDDLPLPLQGKWDRKSILETGVACLPQILPEKKQILHEYLEKTGFLFFSQEFSPEQLIVQTWLQETPQHSSIPLSSEDCYRLIADQHLGTIWQEASRSQDPLVVRCGIAAMLALRPYASKQDYFGKEFQDLVMGLLTEFEHLPENLHHENLRLGEQIIEKMAGYYLRYLDLTAQNVFPESERRVAIAWWLGWRFRKLIAKISEESGDQERVRYFKTWLENIAPRCHMEEIQHVFSQQVGGVARRHTIYPSQPLATATLTMLAPSESEQKASSFSAFAGLTFPTSLLMPEICQRLVDLTSSGAIARVQDSLLCNQETLPWYWHDPHSNAGLRLLETCSTTLTEPQQQQLLLAKIILQDTEFKPIIEKMDDELAYWSYVVYSIANSSILGKGLAEEFRKAVGEASRLNRILKITASPRLSLFSMLCSSVLAFFRSGHIEDGQWLAQRLAAMDFKEFSDDMAENLVEAICFAVMLGTPQDILERCLFAFRSRAKLRDSLRRLKQQLQHCFNAIPVSYRDYVRAVCLLIDSCE